MISTFDSSRSTTSVPKTRRDTEFLKSMGVDTRLSRQMYDEDQRLLPKCNGGMKEEEQWLKIRTTAADIRSILGLSRPRMDAA